MPNRFLFVIALMLSALLSGLSAEAPIAAARSTNANSAAKPWGELEIQRIPLENRDTVFLDREARLQKPAWHFEDFSATQLLSFLDSCDLRPDVRVELGKTNEWLVQSNTCVVFPSYDLILKLNPVERQRLYAVLARSETNYAQRWPFRIPLDGFDERFAGSGLSSNKLELVRGLTYTNGHQLCFCNFGTARKFLNDEEFHAVVDAFYSIPTVRVRLRVTRESDVNTLVAYWGRGGREKKIRPLIESLAKVPGGGDMNISLLLPPFARLRLYTFPDPDADVVEAKTDCFYTSLNFFAEHPDARFLDHNVTRQTLQTDYTMLHGERPTLGDLVTLVNRGGDAFHICVYIADNIVYTKNGENYLQPWVLMRMDDMMAFYGSYDPIRIVVFRRKGT